MNWFVPNSGSRSFKQGSLQTPFTKKGELYLLTIELRDPNIHAIEFVLKDGSRDRWLKLNHGNFRVEIPESEPASLMPGVPKELIERKAFLVWESKGRPMSSPQQQKKDYEDALIEIQNQLSKGISLNDLCSSFPTSSTKRVADNREQPRSAYSFKRKHNVEQWLQKPIAGPSKNTVTSSALMNLVDKYMGGDDVVSRKSYHAGNYEVVVLSKMVRGEYHIMVATNIRGATVLHWGVSKISPGEWLVPPPEIRPKNSNVVPGACQTYFNEMSIGNGVFQQSNFIGIQFVIWSSGSSWIKDNGSNFYVALIPMNSSGKVDGAGEEIDKWLLDEISRREKEAERSLMHRFNIATELTERCKSEVELGLTGMLVWLRFMSCRHLTWNKNYNVKPREISEAQDRFTSLLQKIYINQPKERDPKERDVVRLLMAHVGRGGQGDVGQKIRDEILVVQRNNDCKNGMMEEWHQKLHNNSSPDDVRICEALLHYIKSDFRLDVYWKTLIANGLSKEKLASYDRPIVSEPHFRADTKEGLVHDLTAYLKTLKAVHSGADLESAIEVLIPSNRNHDFRSHICDFSPKLQEYLNFVKAHHSDGDIVPLMEKLLESRIELHPLLNTSHRRLKDILFLDLALASAVKTTMERGLRDLHFSNPPEIMFFISLVLESLCLSTVNNEDLIYCTKDWYHISELYKPNHGLWALQSKAILDRLQLVLADRSQYYQKKIQPSAKYLD